LLYAGTELGLFVSLALRRNVKECGKLLKNDRARVQPDIGMAWVQGVSA